MKKWICSFLAAIIFMFSPLSAFASTTEQAVDYVSDDEYGIMLLDLNDDGDSFSFSVNASIIDYPLNSIIFNSFTGQNSSFSILQGQRFSSSAGTRKWLKSSSNYFDFDLSYQWLHVTCTITSNDDDYLYYTNNGAYINLYGFGVTLQLLNDNVQTASLCLKSNSLVSVYASAYTTEDISCGYSSVNLNDISDCYASSNSASLFIPVNFVSKSYSQPVGSIVLDLVYRLPSNLSSYNGCNVGVGFYDSESYFLGSVYASSGSTATDSEKEIIGSLGTINKTLSSSTSTITNAVNSVKSTVSTIGTNIVNSVSSIGTSITNSISSMSSTLSTGISNLQTSVVTGLTNVQNKVAEIGTNIVNSVSEVKQSILDLPNKLQEMLLGLIVPDADTMANKYSEFSGLLEDKLGIIYQIPMMLFDFFNTIVNAATTPQSTLTLPAFTLPWIDGTTLTVWNPVEFKIMPDGLQVLSDLIKTITSMTVVVLTFNSVKRAYERFLRGD